MTKRLAGEVEAKAFGKAFVFSFRMGAILGAQHDLGIDDADVGTVLSKVVLAADRFEGSLILLHNALKVHHGDITRAEVAEIVSEIGIAGTRLLIQQGLVAAWPEKKTGAWTQKLGERTPGTTIS